MLLLQAILEPCETTNDVTWTHDDDMETGAARKLCALGSPNGSTSRSNGDGTFGWMMVNGMYGSIEA